MTGAALRALARAAARAAILGTGLAALTAMGAESSGYPSSRRVPQSDAYHGQRVADPYRWLEDTASAETRDWIDAQNAYARRYLGRLPGRAYFEARMRALVNYERYGLPQREAGRYVFAYNSGSQEQDSLWISRGAGDPGRVLLDPGAIRADGTVSLGAWDLAPDGRHVAYALSDGGSDWKSWRVRDTDNGADLPEVLLGTKFTDAAWRRDGRGFFYSRYPAGSDAPGGVAAYDDGRQVAIWYHELGTPQARDVEIFRITDHPRRDPYPQVTDDGRYLVIRVEEGYETNGYYIQRIAATGAAQAQAQTVRLLDRWDGLYAFLGNDGPVFYFQTTSQAPMGRIIAIDSRHAAAAGWREVVPQRDVAIAAASLVGGRLFVEYVVDVHSEVQVFRLDGHALGPVALPGPGTVAGFGGKATDTETYYSYTDFTTPPALYRYDVLRARSEPWRVPRAGIRPADYEALQVRYRSRDGTLVPMYVVRRRGLPAGQRQPTVLYGYGGFNVSLLPGYSASRAAWLEAGGVYAVANLRGGGEFGESWHQAGTRLAKQNVFDDFIAAAEWLTANGITDRSQLAIWGGSNGGLLVGAVLNQRPDLFAAAVPAVGVMDMLRYQLASANARQWSSDYGLSEVPDQFRALYAYSPYHNVRPGACYPPTLVMADANDDRVAPWHSYKYAAALQNAQGCDKPVLIRIETRAGHGAGASLSKIVEEYADQWAFVASATGLRLPDARP